VGSYCEEDADAEYFERLLATLDEWPENRPFKSLPVTRQEPVDEEGKNDEMDEAVGREVGFVVSRPLGGSIVRIVMPMRPRYWAVIVRLTLSPNTVPSAS